MGLSAELSGAWFDIMHQVNHSFIEDDLYIVAALRADILKVEEEMKLYSWPNINKNDPRAEKVYDLQDTVAGLQLQLWPWCELMEAKGMPAPEKAQLERILEAASLEELGFMLSREDLARGYEIRLHEARALARAESGRRASSSSGRPSIADGTTRSDGGSTAAEEEARRPHQAPAESQRQEARIHREKKKWALRESGHAPEFKRWRRIWWVLLVGGLVLIGGSYAVPALRDNEDVLRTVSVLALVLSMGAVALDLVVIRKIRKRVIDELMDS